MRLQFIFTFLLLPLLIFAESPLLEDKQLAPYVFETVNVITGDYCETQTDQFSIRRTYRPGDSRHFGWAFNLPNFPFKENTPSESEKFTFDNEGRLKQMKQEDGVLLSIYYESNGCRIESSAGEWLEYRFFESSQSRQQNGVYISQIKASSGELIEYEYTPHPKTRTLLISQQVKSGREICRVQYDEKGKVKTLTSQDGNCFEFAYFPGKTVVSGEQESQTVYFHNDQVLTGIEEYLNGEPYRLTRLFYDTSGRLINKTKEEFGGEILESQTFEYDQNGRVTAKGLYGNLSGECQAKLQLQANGMPKKNGIECDWIKFQYSQKAPFALQTIFYPNGNRIDFQYDETSLRKTAQFLTTPQHLTIRRFYLYDDEGNLCEEIQDDGRCKQRENLTGVNKRTMTRYSKERSEYLYLDPVTHDEILDSRVVFTYSENGELVQKEILNGDLESIARETYAYDEKGRVIRKETNHGVEEAKYDHYGNLIYQLNETSTQELIYDQNNRLIMQTASDASEEKQSVQFQYDRFGRQIGRCDSGGNWTTFTLDSLGRKTAVTYPKVKGGIPEESFAYNIFDQITQKVDPEGKSTSITYNIRGQPTKITYPDGSEERYIYNLDGTKKKCVARSGKYMLFTYDSFGRILEETLYSSDGVVIDSSQTRYNSFHPVQKKELSGRHAQFFYDGLGREVMATHGELKFSQTYNANGDIETKKQWFGPSETDCLLTRFHYNQQRDLLFTQIEDSLGTVLEEKDHCLESETQVEQKCFPYVNDLGQTVTKKIIVKENGASSTLIYDAMNQVEKIITSDPLGKEVACVCIRYDLAGNKVGEVIDNKTVILWQYDCMNRMIARIEDGLTTSYSYTPDGALASTTHPNGVTIYYEYNDRGAMTALYSSDGTVNYTISYDLNNKPIQLLDQTTKEVCSRRYDTQGYLVEEIFPSGAKMQYRNDLMGRRQETVLPDGSKIHYTYTPCHLKTITRLSKEGEILYSQDFFYDKKGRLTHTNSPKLQGIVKYAYDEKGRICGIDSKAYCQSLKRNGEGQVVCVTTNNQEERISYSPSGEIETDTKSHLKGLYDTNGNLIEEGKNRYTYDALNRLIEVRVDEKKTIRYTYDFLGRRLSKEVGSQKEYYLYDDMHDIGTLDSNNTLIHFRLLNPQTGVAQAIAFETETERFGVINTLFCSVGCIIDSSTKQPRETYEYSPFKQENRADLTPWRYKSKRADPDTKLIFFGKRDYAPHLRKWTTKDPLGHFESSDRYCFCLGNPLNYHDLFGGFSFSDVWHILSNGTHFIYDSLQRNFNLFRDQFGYIENTQTQFDELAKAVFGSGFLQLSGYFQDSSEAGIFGEGELSDKVRITLVNGIMNARLDYKNNLDVLSHLHGGMNIHYIFDSSSGWTHDMIKAIFLKAGYVTNEAKLLALTWKKLIKEMGGVDGGGLIIHYAHSLGGCVTQTAGHLLTPEEKKMIRVITIASAAFFQDNEFESITHYISNRDVAFFLSPFESIKSFFNINNHIQWVSSVNNKFPFIDHFILGPTYYKVFHMLSEQFQETYLR